MNRILFKDLHFNRLVLFLIFGFRRSVALKSPGSFAFDLSCEVSRFVKLGKTFTFYVTRMPIRGFALDLKFGSARNLVLMKVLIEMLMVTQAGDVSNTDVIRLRSKTKVAGLFLEAPFMVFPETGPPACLDISREIMAQLLGRFRQG